MAIIKAQDLINDWERFRTEQAPDLLSAAQAALPALELLGDYIGNEFPGKVGYPAFDRCAIIYSLKHAIAEAETSAKA